MVRQRWRSTSTVDLFWFSILTFLCLKRLLRFGDHPLPHTQTQICSVLSFRFQLWFLAFVFPVCTGPKMQPALETRGRHRLWRNSISPYVSVLLNRADLPSRVRSDAGPGRLPCSGV